MNKWKMMPRPKQTRSLDNGRGSVGEGPLWFDTIWP